MRSIKLVHSCLSDLLRVVLRVVAGPVSGCEVTLDIYKSVHGSEPNSSVSNVFGWIELDGLVKDFPTDDSEKVFLADTVDVHDEVHISPCYTW